MSAMPAGSRPFMGSSKMSSWGPDQTRGDAETLAHAHRVLRHLVIGAVKYADALESRSDAIAGAWSASRSEDLEVLPARQMAVNRGSSTMAPTRASARSRCLGTGYPRRDMVPASACVSPNSTRIKVVLPAPLGPR